MDAVSVLKSHVDYASSTDNIKIIKNVTEVLFDNTEKEKFDRAFWEFVTEYVSDPNEGVKNVSLIRELDDLSLRFGEQMKLEKALSAAHNVITEDASRQLSAKSASEGLDGYREELESQRLHGITVPVCTLVRHTKEKEKEKEKKKTKKRKAKENSQ